MAARLSHRDLEALGLEGIDPAEPAPRKPKKARRRKGNSETSLVAACLQYLKVAGIFAWRNNTTGVFDPSKGCFRKNKGQLNGVSDILGVLPDGRFLAVEVKAGKNCASPSQWEFLKNIASNGGLALVVWSVDDLAAAIAKDRAR